MGTDRNTIIGYVLLGVLLLAYIFISTKNSQELAKQKKLYDDSLAVVKIKQDAIARKAETAKTQLAVSSDTSGFNKAIGGAEHLLIVENDVLKIIFTNKGAQPKQVELKKFNSFDSTSVKIIDSSSDTRISYPINTSPTQSSQITDLFFDDGQLTRNADGSQTVSFRLPTPGGESILHQYTIPATGYLINWDVAINNAGKLFTNN